jgi:hypothetical protein
MKTVEDSIIGLVEWIFQGIESGLGAIGHKYL